MPSAAWTIPCAHRLREVAVRLDDFQRGTPLSNEWDKILNKNDGYIKTWNNVYSRGQDTTNFWSEYRAVRGYFSTRYWNDKYATYSSPSVGFRPVLEVLNPDTLVLTD